MAKAFSIEDGNLSSSIVSSRSVSHVDIDLAFKPRPSGEIFKKTDAAAVKQAVKNLLLTSRNEKPFQPNLGQTLIVLCLLLIQNMTRSISQVL